MNRAAALLSTRPAPPTREHACAIRISFQGLTIQSARYGPLPWFTAALGAMNAVGELDATLNQLIAAGDTHAQIDLIFSYGEPGQPWGTPQLVPDCDLSHDLGTYTAIVDRVVERGLLPIFVLPCEGQPGLAWLLSPAFPAWVQAMRSGYDRLAYGPIQLGYDGTWPDSWSAAQVQTVLPYVRSVIGDDAYVCMYFANGPSGSPYLYVVSEDDYSQPWMQALDLVLTSTTADQMVCPSLPNYAQYMLGSNITPTSTCQPSFDAPDFVRTRPRGLMNPLTPRGPFFWGIIEWNEYDWVRGRVSAAQIASERMQAAALNVRILG